MSSSLHKDFDKFLGHTSSHPIGLPVKRAEGSYIYDQEDNAYLDFIAGVTVSSLGHQHPAIQEAVSEQLQQYSHTMVYGEHQQTPQVKLARSLADRLPDSLQKTYFLSSGSEAIEAALKLAKAYTGCKELIAFEGGYHGSTHGALSLTDNDSYRSAFSPLLPLVKFLPFNDSTHLARITKHTAAVLIEPIQGEAGVRLPDSTFLQALQQRCEDTDTLLIFDECQTGFGRTGRLFAFEHYGVIPDILIMAKAMGGGFPLSGLTTSTQIMGTFQNKPPLGHLTTFGGHPVSCAAGLAHLQTLVKESIITQVAEKAQLLRKHLTHPAIQAIRQKGLLFALQFSEEAPIRKIADQCLENGVLVHWFLYASHCIRLAPPLNIKNEEIKKGAALINESIDQVLKVNS
jgi:acetylornithine/succinyldiaminopimelate/putrescine aminotransferase